MKIYTKTGDNGTTGLLGPGRVAKDDPRIECYGTVDELNACLGVARSQELPCEVDSLLGTIQNHLFNLGAALADHDPQGRFFAAITLEHIGLLENAIDLHESTLASLTQFVLPAGSRGASQLHLSRTVCRRTERSLVRLMKQPGEAVAENNLIYLNRLSDLLFVLARAVNAAAGVGDAPWGGL